MDRRSFLSGATTALAGTVLPASASRARPSGTGPTTARDLPKPDHARNMRLVGHSEQGGRPDGVQIMVHRGHAYVGHIFSGGLSVLDVRDPTQPRDVAFIAAPPNTWSMHLQAADDLLLVINAKNLFAAPEFADERNYYTGSIGTRLGERGSAGSRRDWSAGMAVYDISRPEAPHRIGFMPVEGTGIHRIWYTGGRWAYLSALLDGFTDYILLTVDMSDPTRPTEAGRFWLPGMHAAGGEQPTWPKEKRYGLHHAIVNGDTAYAAWRDAGLVVIDVADRAKPRMVAHRNWSPPFGGGTHNCLPLPERDLLVVLDEAVLDNQEDGLKLIWLFDIREPSKPVSISSFPTPAEADYARKGAHFGPHNLHENRPSSFVSSDTIFATYQNAGIRVFDIRDQYRPTEIAAFVPPPPSRLIDKRSKRPRVIQSSDVFVDAQGVIYSSDPNGGFYILERTG